MRLPAQGRRDLPIRSSPTGGNGSFCRPSRLVSRLHSRPRLRFSGQVLRWAGVPDPKFCRFGCCAGVLGAAFGLLSRHRARLGAARAAVTYAANLAIVAGCYGGEVSVP